MLTHKAAQTTTHLVICLMLTSLLLTACGRTTPAKTYTKGVCDLPSQRYRGTGIHQTPT